jgi:hypothetical protein
MDTPEQLLGATEIKLKEEGPINGNKANSD